MGFLAKFFNFLPGFTLNFENLRVSTIATSGGSSLISGLSRPLCRFVTMEAGFENWHIYLQTVKSSRPYPILIRILIRSLSCPYLVIFLSLSDPYPILIRSLPNPYPVLIQSLSGHYSILIRSFSNPYPVLNQSLSSQSSNLIRFLSYPYPVSLS